MKKITFFLIGLCLIVSCNSITPKLSEILKSADAVELRFLNQNAQPFTLKIDSGANLETVRNLVTDENSPEYKCVADAEISYFKSGQLLLKAQLNLGEDCQMASFIENGQTVFRRLNSANVAELVKLNIAAEGPKASPLDGLKGFLGLWKQVEGIDLVSYEEWKIQSDSLYEGRSWTMYAEKQIYEEKIQLLAEGNDIFYIPIVPGNNGPVRFKMTSLDGNHVIFSNPEHDFPQEISYEMRGDTVLFAKISGVKNGKPGTKEFPLRKVN